VVARVSTHRTLTTSGRSARLQDSTATPFKEIMGRQIRLTRVRNIMKKIASRSTTMAA
jgi:hypothetical protein